MSGKAAAPSAPDISFGVYGVSNWVVFGSHAWQVSRGEIQICRLKSEFSGVTGTFAEFCQPDFAR